MFGNRPMKLPDLPEGLFWDLKDDQTSRLNYRWQVVHGDGTLFVAGEWRDHPFGLAARIEVRYGAFRTKLAIEEDRRKAETKEQARLAGMALEQRRQQAQLALTQGRDREVRDLARRKGNR